MKVSIDDGSNFIKLAVNLGTEIKTSLIPSRVVRGLKLGAIGSELNNSYKVNGNVYSVTKESDELIPTNNSFYQTSEVNLVLVHHALRTTNPVEPVSIVVTLPPAQFYLPDGSRNNELINQKVSNLKSEIEYLDNSKPITIEKVFVLPEGVPAFKHAQTSLNLDQGRYLVVDLGGTTTDLIVIDSNLMVDKSDSLQIGALNMLESFSKHVKQKLGVSVGWTDEHALQALLNGSVMGADVSMEANQAKAMLQNRILDHINKFGDTRTFTGVLLTGGGSELLNLGLVNQVKSTAPQFDNALGALAVLESITNG